MQFDQQPSQAFSNLKRAYNELLDIANYNDTPMCLDKWKVYQPPNINTVLQQLDELVVNSDVNQQVKKQTIEEKKTELMEAFQDEEHLSTIFYTQRLIQNMQTKSVKNESINCAHLHAQQGFPQLKTQKDRLMQCQLLSYRLGEQSENRQLKHTSHNVYLSNPITQVAAQLTDMFVVHMTIYHPFTNKKTQEIVARNDATLEQIMDEIDCPIKMTEQKFYSHEVQNFESPQFNFGMNNQLIGDVSIQLCKQYTFTHLNQCKHRVYINEIRSLTINEHGIVYTIFKAPLKIRGCEGCGRSAELFRVQDPLVAGSPIFWCKLCDQLLHHGDTTNSLPYFCD